MKNINKLTLQEILDYEIHSSWFVGYISNDYLQKIIANYYAWKVKRKYKRYSKSLEFRKFLLDNGYLGKRA